jgi:hypothetical protein
MDEEAPTASQFPCRITNIEKHIKVSQESDKVEALARLYFSITG